MGFWSRLSSSASVLPSVEGVSLVVGDVLGAKEHVEAQSGLAGASEEEQTLIGSCWIRVCPQRQGQLSFHRVSTECLSIMARAVGRQGILGQHMNIAAGRLCAQS